MFEPVEKLIEAMQDDLQLHRELGQVLDNKLDAMRHRDISRLEALSVAEHRLLDRMSENGRRRIGAAKEATAIYFPNRHGRDATAKELAKVVEKPLKRKLEALSAMLFDSVQNIERLNRINKIASEKILGHIDHIFSIIAQSGRDIGLYGRAGKKSLLEQNRLVDAIA